MWREQRGFRLGGWIRQGDAARLLLVVGLPLAFVSTGCLSQYDRPSRPSHVVVIVMENKEYGDVIGQPSAPYINGLARRYALATNFYAVSHPSLPNYLALTG